MRLEAVLVLIATFTSCSVAEQEASVLSLDAVVSMPWRGRGPPPPRCSLPAAFKGHLRTVCKNNLSAKCEIVTVDPNPANPFAGLGECKPPCNPMQKLEELQLERATNECKNKKAERGLPCTCKVYEIKENTLQILEVAQKAQEKKIKSSRKRVPAENIKRTYLQMTKGHLQKQPDCDAVLNEQRFHDWLSLNTRNELKHMRDLQQTLGYQLKTAVEDAKSPDAAIKAAANAKILEMTQNSMKAGEQMKVLERSLAGRYRKMTLSTKLGDYDCVRAETQGVLHSFTCNAASEETFGACKGQVLKGLLKEVADGSATPCNAGAPKQATLEATDARQTSKATDLRESAAWPGDKEREEFISRMQKKEKDAKAACKVNEASEKACAAKKEKSHKEIKVKSDARAKEKKVKSDARAKMAAIAKEVKDKANEKQTSGEVTVMVKGSLVLVKNIKCPAIQKDGKSECEVHKFCGHGLSRELTCSEISLFQLECLKL